MYIGDKKIAKLDKEMVYFADGTKKLYTPKQLSYLITKKPKDATAYRDIILDNVVPEVKAALCEDVNESAAKILNIVEQHDLTNAEFMAVLDRIVGDSVTKYNEFVKEALQKKSEEFQKEQQLYKEITRVVADSYNLGFYTATGKAFGTYVEGVHPQSCLDSIRVSDIKRLMN